MYAWRTVDKLGCPAIAARLNADPASYPPPNPGYRLFVLVAICLLSASARAGGGSVLERDV